MANFVAIVDRDPERRERFVAEARARIAFLPGLRPGELHLGSLSVVWATAPNAPVSQEVDAEGAVVVFGNPNDPVQGTVDAGTLGRSWRSGDVPGQYDGYYCALVSDASNGVTLGGDVLGTLPLYYLDGSEVLLVGTSPELFREHPTFRPTLNWTAVAGLLLTNNLMDGRAVVGGTRRLGAGNALRWRPERGGREVPAFEVELTDDLFRLSRREQEDLLGEAVADAVRRHTQQWDDSLLFLSGGHDSRWVGGLLAELGRSTQAFTVGHARDLEARTATRVARALGLEHSIVDADVDRYPEFLGTQLTWEHLAGGLQILYDWGLIPILQRFSGGLATGFFTDAVVGGGAQYRFRAPQGPPSYDGTFAAENAWGLAPRVVKRLLRKDDARELVNDELSRYRDEFDELPGSDLQRSWLLDLRRRQRFHTGRLLWSLSFGAWPMTPMLDRQVLRVAASIQPGTMADRAAQRGIMTRRFPRLARLPIDRNSGDTTPLAPSLRWRATRAARNALAGAHLVRRKVMRHEELFYFRVLDFNSAGWRAIRKLADERKDGVGNLLRVEALDEVLPPWDASTRLQWPLVGSAGLKMLAGMILWLGETGVPAGGEGLAGTGMPVPAGSGS